MVQNESKIKSWAFLNLTSRIISHVSPLVLSQLRQWFSSSSFSPTSLFFSLHPSFLFFLPYLSCLSSLYSVILLELISNFLPSLYFTHLWIPSKSQNCNPDPQATSAWRKKRSVKTKMWAWGLGAWTPQNSPSPHSSVSSLSSREGKIVTVKNLMRL